MCVVAVCQGVCLGVCVITTVGVCDYFTATYVSSGFGQQVVSELALQEKLLLVQLTSMLRTHARVCLGSRIILFLDHACSCL